MSVAFFMYIIKKMKKKSFLLETIEFLLSSILIVFLLIKFILMPCVVSGGSMSPILSDGDFGYSFVVTRNLGIKRFDIVVIRINEEKLLVKRVIGLPGETIAYKNNQLFVNGIQIDEDFLGENVLTQDMEVILSSDEYYCLGDNRQVSRDSRYYGPFKDKEILSSHLFVIYPFKDLGYRN